MPSQAVLIIIAITLFGFLLTFGVIFLLLRLQNKKSVKQGKEDLLTATDIDQDIVNRKKAITDIIGPSGVDPNPNSYTIVNDGGRDKFVRCLTVNELPKKIRFAETFSKLFTYKNTATTIFIEAEAEDLTIKHLDKHITILDGEQIAAHKNGDRPRVRSLGGQLADAESWVSRIEDGKDRFFKAAFLFTLYADSLSELNLLSDAFHMEARKKTIDLSACYSTHPEAFLSGAPFNKQFELKWGPIKRVPLKTHYLSQGAVADIFNHTSSDFIHRTGVPLGRNMDTAGPVFYDPYSPAHKMGYSIIVAGKTGSGKSAMIKMLTSRLSAVEPYYFAAIDSQKRGSRGEYGPVTEKHNGVEYQIMSNTKNIINIFEVNTETCYSETLDKEYEVLRLADRVSEICLTLQMLIQGDKPDAEFKLQSAIERIISDVVDELFRERGIQDDVVDSLFEQKVIEKGNGTKEELRVKKALPTISDFYKKVLTNNKKNTVERYVDAFGIIIDNMKDRVKELYYCELENSISFLDRDTYMALIPDSEGVKNAEINGKFYPVVAVIGTKNYYDGQSTVHFTKGCPFTNFDISHLPEKEKKIARPICMSFITEQFTKRNSENPKKAEKLVVILDECNENYKLKYMRESIENNFRTNRKRNVSTWVGVQALSDGSEYPEVADGIIGNTAVFFLFKQPGKDAEFLAKNTPLTPTQISRVISIGGNYSEDDDDLTEEEKEEERNRHVGEVCIIDDKKVAFCKVDYLVNSEKYVVETDSTKLQEIFTEA